MKQPTVDTAAHPRKLIKVIGPVVILRAPSRRASSSCRWKSILFFIFHVSTDRTWKETPTNFKFSGPTVAGVQEQTALVQKISKEAGSLSFDIGNTQEEVESLWNARKTCLWSFLARKEHADDQFVSSDVAVPISRLADIMEESKSKIKQSI
jgi:FAD/FMN-containing dehydrogenase